MPQDEADPAVEVGSVELPEPSELEERSPPPRPFGSRAVTATEKRGEGQGTEAMGEAELETRRSASRPVRKYAGPVFDAALLEEAGERVASEADEPTAVDLSWVGGTSEAEVPGGTVDSAEPDEVDPAPEEDER